MSKKTQITRIESLNHEGRGVSHINGKTIFLFNALPDETVTFQITRAHRQFDEGITTAIDRPNQDRVTPRCKHYGVCGGCALQHMDDTLQRTHKEKILLEHLQHQARVVPEKIESPLTATPWGYRRRARLSAQFSQQKNKLLVGFRARQSHHVAEITQCETLHPAIGTKITVLSELLSSLSVRAKIPQIEIAIGDAATALILRHLIPLTARDREKLLSSEKTHGFCWYTQSGNANTVTALSAPENNLYYDLKKYSVRLFFTPTQFIQINAEINQKMIERAITWLDVKSDDVVLDLFCGIGNFSLPTARLCKKVIGIEGAEDAIITARNNATYNQMTNIQFITHDLTKSIATLPFCEKKIHKVILDPPRAGATEILEDVSKLKPSHIVYISCNPITLARDAKTLLQLGYSLEKTCVMDMFPQTEHIEAMALFVLCVR